MTEKMHHMVLFSIEMFVGTLHAAITSVISCSIFFFFLRINIPNALWEMKIFFCWRARSDSDEELGETPQMYLDAWVMMVQQTLREARNRHTVSNESFVPSESTVELLIELDKTLQQGYNTTMKGGFQHTDITREIVQRVREDRWCIFHSLISEMLHEMNRVGFVQEDGESYPDEKRFKKVT